MILTDAEYLGKLDMLRRNIEQLRAYVRCFLIPFSLENMQTFLRTMVMTFEIVCINFSCHVLTCLLILHLTVVTTTVAVSS